MSDSMKIVVTGATGFLGGRLTSALVRRGYEVVGIGRNPERARNVEMHGIRMLLGDVADRDFIFRAIRGADAVIHAAALSAPWGRHRAFYVANVAGTQNVVDACQSLGVNRIIHISSPSVTFSGCDVLLQTEGCPYPSHYLSYYSQSKKLAEDIVNKAIWGGLAATILRPKAIFGPGDTTLLPRIVTMARLNHLTQIGKGNNLIDITYVENVVQGIMMTLRSDRSIGKTYVVTNDEHVPLWDVIRRIARDIAGVRTLQQVNYKVAYLMAAILEARAALSGKEPRLTRYSVALMGKHQTYDISAFKSDTGYAPEISIQEAVQRTIDDYKQSDRTNYVN